MKQFPNRAMTRILTVALFGVVGTLHFINPDPFVRIVPVRLPHPLALVYLSGACEILGAIGLLVPACRRAAGLGLLLLLVAVFPANVRMFHLSWQSDGWSVPTILLALRLPLQFIFMALVNWVSHSDSAAVKLSCQPSRR